MNKNSKRLSFYIFMMLAIAIAACVIRTLSCVWDLEDNLIYFSDKALLLSGVIVTMAGAVLLFTSIFTQDMVALKASFSTPMTYIPTGVVAISLIALAIRLLITSGEIASPLTVLESFGKPSCLLAVLSAILAFVSVAHFFFTAFLTERHTEKRAYFSLGTILFLAVYSTLLYFDSAAPLNSPNKITEQMACLFSAIFFLYEARISLGREMWRGYTSFGLISALLLAYSSIPAILTYFIRGVVISASLEASVFALALFVFITARLITVTQIRDECEARGISTLREYAQRREEELAASRGTQRKIVEDIQMTIDDILGTEPASDVPEEYIPESVAEIPDGEEPEQLSIPYAEESEKTAEEK